MVKAIEKALELNGSYMGGRELEVTMASHREEYYGFTECYFQCYMILLLIGLLFLGAEVKAGKSLKMKPDEDCLIHLSQVCIDNGRKGETALLFVTVDGKKLVIGTLSHENIPQISLDLIFDQEFELSHSLETGSVHFIGYKSPNIDEEEYYSSSDCSSEEDVEVPATVTANGNAGAAATLGTKGQARRSEA
ncbi:hypothetical protein Bca4012_025607 [Brassica carinata]